MMIIRTIPHGNRATFKRGAILLLVALAVFSTVAGVRAAVEVLQSDDDGAGPHGPSVLGSVRSSEGTRVVDVAATAFSSTVVLEIPLEEPLPDGHVPAADRQDMSIHPADGAAPLQIRSIGFDTNAARDVLTVTAQADAIPGDADALEITLHQFYVVPPEGNGQPVAGPFTADVAVESSSIPEPKEVTQPGDGSWTVPTGDGWSYVIDRVHYDGVAVRVDYHVAGELDRLRNYYSLDHPENMLAYPENGTSATATMSQALAANGVLDIEFAPALRRQAAPAEATFPADGIAILPNDNWRDTWKQDRHVDATIAVHGKDAPVGIFHDKPRFGPDTGMITILVESEAHIGDHGLGATATLTDDLGNSYRVSGSGSNLPPTLSHFTFDGPVAPEAETVTFELHDVGVQEGPGQSLQVALN